MIQDGTINYLSLPVITAGLGFLRLYLPFLPVRLSTLLHYLSRSLSELRHPSTGGPAASILSHLPSEPVKYIGEASSAGFVLSFLFLDVGVHLSSISTSLTLAQPRGEPLPLEFIEHASASRGISLRTGCMCNPGGSAVLLGLGSLMKRLDEVPDASLAALERMAGRSLGVVRVSLGIASNFEDAWRVVAFARELTDERARSCMWEEWKAEPRT
jgi:molybdenum cofactor sulfurtransferase